VFKINIVKFLIIHVIIIFLDEFKEDYGLVMDFWNDNINFVTQKKWKMWTQKNAKIVFKLKLKNKHYQMKNLLVKCIDIFPIYIF